MSQQINLLNRDLQKQRHPFSALALLQTVVVVLLGIILIGGFAQFQIQRLQSNADQVSTQLHETEQQVAKLRATTGIASHRPQLEAELKQVDADLQMKQRIANILKSSDFGYTAGYSVYLTAFARQIPKGVWLTGLSIGGDGTEIGLRGRALKPELVAEYVKQLKTERVMQGKDFTSVHIGVPSTDQTQSDGRTSSSNSNGVVSKKEGATSSKVAYLEFDMNSAATTEKEKLAGSKEK